MERKGTTERRGGDGTEGDTSGEEGGIGRLQRQESRGTKRHRRTSERGTAKRKAVALVEAGQVRSDCGAPVEDDTQMFLQMRIIKIVLGLRMSNYMNFDIFPLEISLMLSANEQFHVSKERNQRVGEMIQCDPSFSSFSTLNMVYNGHLITRIFGDFLRAMS